jgi:8-oxo-dGTP pyrophosphatase MutT (NUDIX family)
MEEESGRVREQSAAVPFRMEEGGLRVLLITASTSPRWVIPKGWIEPDLTPWDSAAKEALEEGGVVGAVSPDPLGDYEYTKYGSPYRVRVYPLRVEKILDKWPEAYRRRRRWVSLEEATELVPDAGLKRLLERLPAIVKKGGLGKAPREPHPGP